MLEDTKQLFRNYKCTLFDKKNRNM